MNFLIRLLLIVAILMILKFTAVFSSKLVDKVNTQRIAKLTELNRRLIEQNKSLENDYHYIYENMVLVNKKMRKFKKENEELKKQLDKQEHVTYNYDINKEEE